MSRLEGAQVALGWSRSPETRARFEHEVGAATVEDWRILCSSPLVDAVLVCTPNAEHARQAGAALEAGKHVLVETPLATRHAEARALAELATSANLVLHHGVKRRYHPDRGEHIAQLRGVGELLTGYEHVAFDYGVERAWYRDIAATGGARSFLPYAMSPWLEAYGAVTSAVGAQTVCANGTWSAASVTLRFASGGYVIVTYALGLGVASLNMRQTVGTRGALYSVLDGPDLWVDAWGQCAVPKGEVDIVACECQAFLDEIRGLRDHRRYLELDVRALELVEQALGGPPA